jgi:hypothetical protein
MWLRSDARHDYFLGSKPKLRSVVVPHCSKFRGGYEFRPCHGGESSKNRAKRRHPMASLRVVYEELGHRPVAARRRATTRAPKN